ncbi:STAS domain-containing protein [Streptomyces longwoodensis]|uniref:STAS domain-containing protein n=1 Tax=Streptomyces longwoodensis TaxID=68231 RepID=UPI0033D900C7
MIPITSRHGRRSSFREETQESADVDALGLNPLHCIALRRDEFSCSGLRLACVASAHARQDQAPLLAPGLGETLERAVTSGAHRVAVDLSAVSFCDCSCVNVLLAALEVGRRNGAIVVCEGLSSDR